MSKSIPIVNLPDLYVDNLQLTKTSNTLLTVSTGQARDSSNTYDIVVSVPLVINTAFKGAGGLDTGTLAANTLYAVFVIFDTTNQVPVSSVFSLSATDPVMPSTRGVTYGAFRRVGWIRTNATSQITDFYMVGNSHERTVTYSLTKGDAVILTAGNSDTFTPITLMAGFVPSTSTRVKFVYQFNNALAGAVAGFIPSDASLSEVDTTDFVVGSGSASGAVSGQLDMQTGPDQLVQYYVETASDSMDIYIKGYVDYI